MRVKSTLDSTDAAQICSKCETAAISSGAFVSIAILDESGSLLRFVRMDGARGHTIDLAMRKARSAAAVAVPTRVIDERIRAGNLTNVEPIGWGGVPVQIGRECVGAIGISGSSPELDDKIAAEAAVAFRQEFEASGQQSPVN